MKWKREKGIHININFRLATCLDNKFTQFSMATTVCLMLETRRRHCPTQSVSISTPVEADQDK